MSNANPVGAPNDPKVPAVVPADFSEHAGAGMENAGREDMAIPFLSILQGLSPEVKRTEGAYIPGALEGMILNTVTKEVVDTSVAGPVTVVPCAYHRAFVEWRVREKGGGFVAEHDQASELQYKTTRDERGRDILPNGNQLNDTRTFYVLIVDAAGNANPAVITMTSTQIKKAKQWMMQQNLLKLTGPNGSYTPPMFASKWEITTVPESNEKGSWFGWKFTHGGYLAGPADPVFVLARDFHKSVKEGQTRADLAKSGDAPKPARVDPDTGESVGEDDIPF